MGEIAWSVHKQQPTFQQGKPPCAHADPRAVQILSPRI